MTNKCFFHHISTKALRALILETIRVVSRYAISNEAVFTQRVREVSQLRQAEAARDRKRKLNRDRKRSAEYEREQAELDACAKYLRAASNNLNQIARRVNSGGGCQGIGGAVVAVGGVKAVGGVLSLVRVPFAPASMSAVSRFRSGRSKFPPEYPSSV